MDVAVDVASAVAAVELETAVVAGVADAVEAVIAVDASEEEIAVVDSVPCSFVVGDAT